MPVLSVAKAELRILLREKGNFFWLIVMPIAFMIVFGSIFGRATDPSRSVLTQIVSGYTVMFAFYVIISLVRRILRDKESGMIARLFTTRLTPPQYLAGMWIPYWIVVLVQCTVLLTFGHVVYGVHLGNLLAIGVVLGVLGICTTAIGLLFAVAVRSDNQAIAFTQILALGGAALGGLWFPIDMMPHGLQIVGHFTPQYWAQQGLQDIMLRGADVADVWPSLAAIAGFAALAATLALMRFRRFLHDAVTHQNVG